MSPSLSSKQAWPRKRIFIGLLGSRCRRVSVGDRTRAQLPANRDADQHPDPRLLGEQGAHAVTVRVGLGRGVAHLVLVGLDEPAAGVERLVQDALQLRRARAMRRLGVAEALGLAQRARSRRRAARR